MRTSAKGRAKWMLQSLYFKIKVKAGGHTLHVQNVVCSIFTHTPGQISNSHESFVVLYHLFIMGLL